MAYMTQENKKKIAAELKKVIPAGWRWSLAVQHHSALSLTIAAAPIDLLKMNTGSNNVGVGYTSLHEYYLEREFSGELLSLFIAIKDAMNTGNHDRSDSQTDYFDVGWYININIGRWEKNFVCTATPEYAALWARTFRFVPPAVFSELTPNETLTAACQKTPEQQNAVLRRIIAPEYDAVTAADVCETLETAVGRA